MAMPSVCRVCLSDNLPLHNLTINNLTQIYEKLTNIQYNKDGYPLSMCYLCLLVLRRCYRFKETARDSDKVLQQWYKKQTEHKVFKARPLFNLTTSDVSLDLNVKSEAAVAEARQIKQENIDDDAEKEIYLEVEKPAEETNDIEYTLETLSTDNIIDNIDFDHSDSDNETKPFQNIDRQQTRSVKNEKEDSGSKKSEESNICPMNEKPGCSKSIRNAPKSGTRPVKTIRDAGPEDTSPTIITTVKIKKEKKQMRKTHPCPICHIRFLYLKSVKIHVSVEHNGDKPFACDVCDFKTVHKQYLKKHQFLHSMDDNDKPYACDLCDHRTAYKYSLKEHRKTHFNDERKYPCHVCNLRFINKHKLKSHLQTHTKDKPFLCDLCAFKSKYQSSLDYHVKAAHSRDKTLLLQCDSCDKKFANQLCLRQHTKRIHNSVKAYSCDLCDYKGVDKADLRNHSTRHSDERPYECHLCDMKFKKRYTLKNHVRTHTGEKPFICNLCDFKCSQKGSLNVHLKRHTAK